MLSLDQGELASFQSSERLSNDYEFSWRFGTQLSDLDKFQIATKDVIAGTYKVYLQVTDKEGKKTNVTAQLIVRDPEVDKTEIPNFVGKSIDEIDELLKEAKLAKGEVSQKEVTENQGQVLTQFPRSGTEVNVNSKVDLVVGIGSDIDVPEVTGKNIDEANTILAQNDFKVSIEKKIADAEEGTVLSQTPEAGESLKQGGAIKLTVAEKKEEPQPEPIKPLAVEIKTTASSVEQGTDVVFNAVLTERIDGEDYRYAWSFGRQTGDQRQFTIKTDDMALGEHSIQLQVKGDKGRVANSEVVLDIREKRLLVPVLKGLSIEEAKKALKKAGLVVGTTEQKEGKVKQATVQQQIPASGKSVSKGQRVDLVVLIPEKEKIAPARVDMSFDNTVGKAGEPIVFTTTVTTQADLKDVHYVYNINNTKKASVDQRFVWTPETEGSYSVSVTAYNDGGVIARSKPYTLTIDAGWEKPIAKLLPKKIDVQQGDKVEFMSNSTYDLNSTLKYQWVSSSGHNGNKKRFSIDTLGVNAGDYDVTLTIIDDKGSQSTATASFSVQEVLESPVPSVNESDNKGNSGQSNNNSVVQFSADQKTTQEPSVRLNTSRRIAQIGQNIQFTMQVNPAVKDIETLYYYQLGDKKRRQWMQTAAFEHQYEDFGSYAVRAVIKQNGKVYYSDSVTVWVWSSWLLGMVGGLVLLLLLFIIWWAKRSNEDFNKPSYYHQADEERIPLLRTDERDEKIDDSVVAVIPEKKEQYDIVTEKREVKHQHPQDSVKSVLLKGVIQFILGILLSFIILYIILKFMGLV